VAICQGKVNGHQASILIDSGAAVTVVRDTFANSVLTPTNMKLTAANGNRLNCLGIDRTEIRLADLCSIHPSMVANEISFDVIIGNDWLQKHKAELSYDKLLLSIPHHGETSFSISHSVKPPHLLVCETEEFSTIKFRTVKSVELEASAQAEVIVSFTSKLELPTTVLIEMPDEFITRYGVAFKPALVEIEGTGELTLYLQNLEDYRKYLPKGAVVGLGETVNHTDISQINSVVASTDLPTSSRLLTDDQIRQLDINPNMDDEDKEKLIALLRRYGSCFAWDFSTLGDCTLEPFTIDTGDNKPVYSAPYRQSASERLEINKQIEDMLKNGIIEPSDGP
jgi:hypothetical protein